MADKRENLADYLTMVQNSQFGVAPTVTNASALESMQKLLQPTQVNKYDIFTNLPSTTRRAGLDATKNQLGAKARAMLPDTGTFVQAILDRDIYSGSENAYTNALQKMGEVYMKGYAANPYFAFTKPAKDLARRMQAIVTSPELAKLEELKLNEEEAIKKAKESGVYTNPMVKNGKVMVERDGVITYVLPNKIQESDKIYTIEDAHNLRVNGRTNSVLDADMNSYDDVWDKLEKSASGLGTTTMEDMFGKTTKSQEQQKALRKAWLENQGLTQQDWNTLTSEFIKRGNVANTPEDVRNWTMNNLEDYITSSMDESTTREGSGANSGGGASGYGNLNDTLGPLQSQFEGGLVPKIELSVDSQKLTDFQQREQQIFNYWKENGQKVSIVQPLNGNLWNNGPTNMRDEDNEITTINSGEAPLADNSIIDAIWDKSQAITTVDGYALPLDSTIPDKSKNPFIAHEKNADGTTQAYMYVPVITSNDEWNLEGEDITEDSEFVGHTDEQGTFTQGSMGDLRNNLNNMDVRKVKRYSQVMRNTPQEEWVAHGNHEEVYESVVKIPLSDDYVTQIRLLDGKGLNAPKEFNVPNTLRYNTKEEEPINLIKEK